MEEITHIELAGSWSGSPATAAALMAFCIAVVSSVEPLHAAPYCPGVVVETAVTVVVDAGVVVVVVDTRVVVVAEADLVGDEVGELTDNPMARPIPRVAKMAATSATRTTVLRRTVITRWSSSATGYKALLASSRRRPGIWRNPKGKCQYWEARGMN